MFMAMSPEDMDRVEAANHARRERFMQFMESMEPDRLGVFHEMMMSCAQLDDPHHGLNYLIGQASMVLRLKYGSCVCGENHDREALQETAADINAERAAKDAAENQAAMNAYNLMLGHDNKLYCKGCGLHYVSLEDRMLRRPGEDGCHGCQLKSAHG